MTFTFDETTAAMLRSTAARLGKPQSAVVREAVAEYSTRAGRLTESERLRLLRAFDELVPAIRARSREEIERELQEIRRARRSGGRRSRVDDR